MSTYRVLSGKVHIPGDGVGEGETYGEGETFEAQLTEEQEATLEVEAVTGNDGDESEDDDAEPEEPEGDDDAEEDGTASDGEAPPETLTAEWVEDAPYPQLRQAASRFEDVNGNWGEDRLRSELRQKVEG